MARLSDEHPAIRRIVKTRQGFLTWRAEFPERVKELRAQQREYYVHHMEDALLEAYDLGTSVRHMMEAYGTQDSRVINKMIDNALKRRDATEPASDYDALAESLRLQQR